MALLKFKRSAVPAKIPSIADLDLGELAINTYDGKVYTKKDDGTQSIVEVGGSSTSLGTMATQNADAVAITGGTITGVTMDSITNHVGADHIHYKVKATQTLAKGDVVKVVGFNSGEDAFEVAKVSASTDIAVGVIYSPLVSGEFGSIINTGLLEGIDTSAYAIGTTLYPNTTGGFTSTKPTTGRYQALAFVVRSHANLGTILIEASEPQPTSLSQFTNDSGYITGITSGNVTTALGYTPANRAGDTFTGPITVNSGANQVILGSDGAIELTRGAGGAYFDFKNSTAEDFDVRLQASGNQLNISAAGGLTLNGAGVLTGITSGQVTTALGYTPANKAGDTFTGSVTIPELFVSDNTPTFTSSAFQYHLHQSPHVAYVKQTGGYNWYWRRNSTGTLSGTDEVEDMSLTEDGNLLVRSSVRAPIFYDTPNTAYFVDPSSTSNLVGLTVANTISGSISGNAATVSSITNLTNLGKNSLIAGVVDGLTTTNFRTTMFGNAVSTYNIVTSRWNNVPTAFSGLGPYGTAIAWSGSDTHAFLALNYNTAGAKIGGGSSDNINWSADLLHSANYTSYAMPSGSSATNSVDVRAPIFYDSNNTGYYVDPAGNSLLYKFENINQRCAYDRAWDNYPSITVFNNTDQGPVGDFRIHGIGGPSGGDFNVRLLVDGDIQTLNALRAGSAAYAPIFYDSNNTAFYIDPATGSYLSGATFTDLITGRNSPSTDVNTANDTGSISIRGSTTTVAAMSFHRTGAYAMNMGLGTDNVFRIGGWSAQSNCLQVFGTGVVQALNDFRAPLFYDSNNTGYYLDPNNTSNLAGLTVGDRISGSVSGCTFTQDSQDQDNITLRTDSGFYQSSTGTNAEGWPLNDSGWQHMISCTHTNDGNYFAMQLAAGFFSTGLFYRSVNNNGAQAWSRVALYGNGYAAPLYANVYYDADNTTYYLDPSTNGTSLNVAGAIVAGGNITAYSDIRVKANVETIPNALDKLDFIRGVTYTRTDRDDKERRYAGVIAQEIEKVLPEAIFENEEYKSVDYNATIGLLIQAIKELRDEVEALKNRS